jgi:hypothetical protein
VEWSAPEATAESRIVTTAQFRLARECEASIPWDQVGPTAGTSVKRSSPPLPVTSELIEVGAVIPDPETGPMHPRGLSDPAPRGTLRSAVLRHRSPGRAVFDVDARAQVLMRSAMPGRCASTATAVMLVSISPFADAPNATSNGRIRARGTA